MSEKSLTVCEDFCFPLSFSRRFYPSTVDLRKIIYRQRQRQLTGVLDEEAMLKLVEKYSVDTSDST